MYHQKAGKQLVNLQKQNWWMFMVYFSGVQAKNSACN